MQNSENTESHVNCERVQDPYSIRCVPQVHGASRNALNHLKELVQIESDLSFSRTFFNIGTGKWSNTSILKDKAKIKTNLFLFKE